MTDRSVTQAALLHCFDEIDALAADLGDDEWGVQSLCPEWDIRGCLTHVVGVDDLLVENGRARAAIVLPADPIPLELEAAEEIVTHIELISGAKLSIITADEVSDLIPIYVGRACPESLRDELARRRRYVVSR